MNNMSKNNQSTGNWYGGKIPVENNTSKIPLILLGFYELVL